MSLLILTGNKTETEKKLLNLLQRWEHINYRWDGRAESDCIDIINSNASEICMYGITFLMGKAKNNDAVNILLSVAKRIGDKIKHDEKKCMKKEHWFDDECVETMANNICFKEIETRM